MKFGEIHLNSGEIWWNLVKFTWIGVDFGVEKNLPSCGPPKTFIYKRFGRSAAWQDLFRIPTRMRWNSVKFTQFWWNLVKFGEIHLNSGEIWWNLVKFTWIGVDFGVEKNLPSCGPPKTYIYTFWEIRSLAGSFPDPHQNRVKSDEIHLSLVKFGEIWWNSPKFWWNLVKFDEISWNSPELEWILVWKRACQAADRPKRIYIYIRFGRSAAWQALFRIPTRIGWNLVKSTQFWWNLMKFGEIHLKFGESWWNSPQL